jgi:hypothetical protein
MVTYIPRGDRRGVDELAEVEGYDSRSEKLCEMVRSEVSQNAGGRSEYVPSDELMRDIYEAALEHARKPGFTLQVDLLGSQLAQEVGVATATVEKLLYMLQGAGYAKRQGKHPADTTDVESWKVKPRCADPEQWKHSRLVRDGDGER